MMKEDEADAGEPSVLQKIPKTIGDLVDELTQTGRLSDIQLRAKAMFIEKQYALASLKIKSCNGTKVFGVPFSEAWCGAEICTDVLYSIGTIFVKGLWLLEGIFENRNYEPPDEESTLALEKLLSYLCDEDCMNFLVNLKKKLSRKLSSETRLAVAVAEHLLGKLAVHSEYTLNSTTAINETHCQCGCMTPVSDKFGDTTIGQSSVWHGSIDILLGKSEVPVAVSNDPVIPGRRTSPEDKYRAYHSIDSISTKSQMLAQTIVFSFLQKKRHPESTHFLIPCIGLTASQVIFYFYDSRHDILLQSTSMKYLDSKGSVRYDTIIALWLVLNYKCLGTGPSKTILERTKSGFYRHAREILDIYHDFLEIGGIPVSCKAEQFKPVNCQNARFDRSLPLFKFFR